LFTPTILDGSKFEQTMSAVKAVVDDLAKDIGDAKGNFDTLTDAARALGNGKYGPVAVAEAMKSLGQAGLTSSQILAGIKPVLDLAAAGEMQLGAAADHAADSMNAFGLRASDLNRVVDAMAAAASASTINISDMAETLKYASPLAAALGQSIESVSTGIGLLGNAGLKGSMAGTGLAHVFQQLSKKADEADEMLRRYGSSFAAVDPQVKSLTEIVLEFQRVGVSTADMMDFFGAFAGRAMLSLKNTTTEAIAKMTEALQNNLGSAADQAAIRLQNVRGTWAELRSALQNLNIEVFNAMKQQISEVLKTATQLIIKFQLWASENSKIVATIGTVAGGLAAFAAAVAAVGVPLGVTVMALGNLAAAAGTVIAALGNIEVAIGAGLAAAFTGLLIPILISLGQHFDELKEIASLTWTQGIEPFIAGMQEGFPTALAGVQEAFSGLNTAVGGALGHWKEALQNLDPAKVSDFGNLFVQIMGQIAEAVINASTIIVKNLKLIYEGLKLVIPGLGVVFDLSEKLLGEASGGAAEVKKSYDELVAIFDELKLRADAFTESSGEQVENARKVVKEQQELVSLLERQSHLKPSEFGKLGDLMDRNPNMRGDLENSVDATKAQLTKAEQELAKAKAAQRDLAPNSDLYAQAGERIRALTEVVRRWRDTLATAERNLKDFDKALEDNPGMLDKDADGFRKLSAELREYEAAINKAKAAQEAMGKGENKFQRAVDSIDEPKQTGTAGELQKADQLKEKNEEILKQRREQLSAMIEGMEAAGAMNDRFDDQIKKLKEQRELHKDNAEKVAELDKRLKVLNDAQQAANANRIESELRVKELREDRDKVDELLIKNQANTEDKKTKIMEQAEQKRKAHLLDLEADAAREKGNHTLQAKKEAEKFLEEEKKKLDDLYQLDGVNDAKITAERQAAEEAAERKAQAMREKGIKEDAQAKKKKAKDVLGDAEKAAEQSLAKQVHSVEQLYALYQAIAAIRRDQEHRAEMAALKALELERQAQNKAAKAVARPTDAVAQNRALQAQNAARVAKAFASARANQAGVEDPFGEASDLGMKVHENQVRNSARAAVNLRKTIDGALDTIFSRFEELQERISSVGETLATSFGSDKFQPLIDGVYELRDNIINALDSIQNEFTFAPEKWSSAFLAAWQGAAQQIVDAVISTMEQIKHEMDPETKHSPSLVDVWNMNVDTVRGGINRIGSVLSKFGPQMSGLSLGTLVHPRPHPMIAGVPTQVGSSSTINDHRSMTMHVNTSYGLADMKRHVGNVIGDAFAAKGTR
jgi:TP901 family phage tail tape measure protein